MGYAELFVTVMIYGVLGFGYLKYHSEQKKTTRSKIIRKSLCFFFLLNTLSLVVFVLAEKTSKVENGAIERNVQGEGEKKEEVLVSVEGMCEEIPMVINVSEKDIPRRRWKNPGKGSRQAWQPYSWGKQVKKPCVKGFASSVRCGRAAGCDPVGTGQL